MTMTMSEELDKVVDALTTAVVHQDHDTDPAHEDFYAWGWALTDTLGALQQVVRALSSQVGRYGDNRILRDDEDQDPAERLALAKARLAEMHQALERAGIAAGLYHSAVGHIAVEVDPG